MDKEQIKFEDLPKATSELKSEVKALRASVELLASKLDSPPSKDEDNELIGVDEACRILGLKKPTVYHKAQRKEIKSYNLCSNDRISRHGSRAAAVSSTVKPS